MSGEVWMGNRIPCYQFKIVILQTREFQSDEKRIHRILDYKCRKELEGSKSYDYF